VVPGSIEKDEAMSSKKSSKKQTSSSIEQRPVKRKKIVTLAEYEAAAAKQPAPGGAGAKTPTEPTPAAKAAKERPTGERGVKGAKRVSGLDAAAKVLAEAGEPLNCKTIVDRMLAKGLWKTSGKTPQNTLHAAVCKEITKKGAKSRFRKVNRGRFELAK